MPFKYFASQRILRAGLELLNEMTVLASTLAVLEV
jgi:hypothetical protein